MNSHQEESHDGIHDPLFNQMVEDFRRQSRAIATYHLYNIRRSLFDQMRAVPMVSEPPQRDEPPSTLSVVGKIVRDSCVKAGTWLVREAIARLEQKAQAQSPAPEKAAAVIEVKPMVQAAMEMDVTPVTQEVKKAKTARKPKGQHGKSDPV